MRRRAFAALLSSTALPLAGCLESDAEGGLTPSATETDATPSETVDGSQTEATETGTESTRNSRTNTTEASTGPMKLGETATVDGIGDVTVTAITVQRSVINYVDSSFRELHEPDDAQVLIVETRTEQGIDDPSADPLSFGLRVDGERVAGDRIELFGSPRRQAVAVPVRDADEAAVVLKGSGPGGWPVWSLPDGSRERLASKPEFRVRDATVRVSDRGTELALTVANTGDRDGTFRAIVRAETTHTDAPVRFSVPAGDAVTSVVRNDIVSNWGPDDDLPNEVTADSRYFATDR